MYRSLGRAGPSGGGVKMRETGNEVDHWYPRLMPWMELKSVEPQQQTDEVDESAGS